tara:strand:+ start:98 stop:220 length:123 start_codon:yes stop_codon:yes gene_type:complete
MFKKNKLLNIKIKKNWALTSLGMIEWKSEDESAWWWKYKS